MQNNKDDLGLVISELNQYLHVGYTLKLTYLKKHDVDGQKEAFDVDELKKEYNEKINIWFKEIADHLQKLDFQYLFHFVQPKDDAMSYSHPLGNLTHALEKHLFALEDVIVRLEERKNLAVRQEIADKEYQVDTLYKITYSEHLREIKLNNIVLANLQSDSKNVNFFEYVFSNPNIPLAVSDIEEATAMPLASNIQDILRDLGFKGNIRKVFFPIATKAKVMFMNPISKQYAIKNDLPIIKLLKDNEIEREATN